ncbi:SMI1/KNR4 family protein [Paractinoplanes toevensis]|nr:SMI1/KNR4 family protein [Actinoplanes toevensis]
MTDDVATFWRDIVSWLETNTPCEIVRIRPPASDASIAEIESAIGHPVPDSMRQWWQLTDGVTQVGTPVIPPRFAPLPCAMALQEMQLRLSIMTDEPIIPNDGSIDTAGESTHRFHHLFLPIAEDNSGDLICIDLRSGHLQGCLILWDHEGGWHDAFLWTNVAAMLEDVRNAMRDGTPALSAYAIRHARYFAGYDIEHVAWKADVSPSMELSWKSERVEVPDVE